MHRALWAPTLALCMGCVWGWVHDGCEYGAGCDGRFYATAPKGRLYQGPAGAATETCMGLAVNGALACRGSGRLVFPTVVCSGMRAGRCGGAAAACVWRHCAPHAPLRADTSAGLRVLYVGSGGGRGCAACTCATRTALRWCAWATAAVQQAAMGASGERQAALTCIHARTRAQNVDGTRDCNSFLCSLPPRTTMPY